MTFAEPSSCFYDPMHILIDDPDSAADDDRLILIGASSKSQILVVGHVDIAGDKIRIISARKAANTERSHDEEV